jgi:hypothetical protein
MRRLPLRRVIWGAFSLSWQNRASLFRATALPLLAVIACTLAWDLSSLYSSGMARWAVYLMLNLPWLIAASWLAISVHRLVLLEGSGAGMNLDLASARRLAIFAATGIGIWVLFTGLTMLIAGGVLNIFSPPRYVSTAELPAAPQPIDLPIPFEWITSLASILAYWFVARVSLMLPAIAIDQRPSLGAAWRASQRNGWRLAIVVGLLPWCMDHFVDLLYRDGASNVEFGILVVLGTLLIVIEIVALSLAYWELRQPAPPPTDPPA